ncbi:MAG: LruC domain-containing protein [Bacteroidetes bacterium]|nr:LruC domain-containing protein [Bacteroidota bacterium]
MKIKIYTIAFLFAISLFFASCHKDKTNNNPDNNIDNFLELKVSESFDFESFSNLETDIKLASTKATGVEIIQIYDAHPANGGKIILTGSVNESGEFKLPVRIASRLSEVYVGKLSSSGTNEFVAAQVSNSKIKVDFSNTNKSVADNDPCTTGCTTTATGTYNSNYTITSGQIVCVDEGTSATFKKLHIDAGGTLRVCGNVTVINYQGGSGDGLLLVNSTGTVTLPNYSVDLAVENYGNLNFSGNGTISVNGSIQNWGDISSSIKMLLKGSMTNNGNFSISKDFEINPDATLINNCQFYTTHNDDFKQSGYFENNGYLSVDGELDLTGSGNKKTTLGIGSLIDTEEFKIEGEIVGPASQGAQITATDDSQTSGGSSITGHVDLWVKGNNDIQPNNGTKGDDVTYHAYTITAPSCGTYTAPSITSSLQLGGLVNQAITPYVITASGTEPITYTIVGTLPAGLTYNASTHTISGIPTAAGTVNIEMTATNFMGSDTKTLVINITQPTAPPVITSSLTGNTTVLEDYTYQVTGTGEPTITYNATNLPDGLTFNSTTNQITGNPTTAGTYNINLSATNGGGTTTEILVLTVGTPPTITNGLTATGTAGVQFNTFDVTATGSPTIIYSAASVPAGLTFNPATQTINGTPLYPGVYDVILTATNDYGTDTKTLVITIGEGLVPPDITSSLAETGMKDFPYTYTITADGSVPMTFTVSEGDLPAGLTFNGNGFSGIPTETGTFNITLTATNDAGTDSELLVLTIGTGGGTDTDGDGIPDNLDAYPTDPTRAFNSYYPNETDYGSFAFEDLWPGYGDYDFNDLVVNFNYKIVTNAQNETVDVITKFQIMAAGASQNNGFGIEFDAPSSSVGSVTGCMKFGNAVQIDPKGFEVGHTNTTVIIPFDAITNIMEGGIVNTVPGGNYVQTTVNTVTTHFDIPQASIGTPPFNPFIFVDQTRGYEVHLKNQPPTELVDPDYFDTYHDASNPEAGTYYVSETGLPWGIEVPVNFNYPIEKADILTAHLKFAAWAQSAGVEYPNWYLDNAGYRNAANIYVVP